MDETCDDQEAHIVSSWQRNALPWADAIASQAIESRRLVTNQAVVDAITSVAPATVLDIGCGEGWLARELSAKGIRVTAIDVVPALIDRAQQLDRDGDYRCLAYQQLGSQLPAAGYDVAVANFSLLGNTSVDTVLAAVPHLLSAGGHFIVQTLHPLAACGDQPYRDGWRAGSWQGFGDAFQDPAPWYFRTLESWQAALSSGRLQLVATVEPRHPVTGQYLSVVLVARCD